MKTHPAKSINFPLKSVLESYAVYETEATSAEKVVTFTFKWKYIKKNQFGVSVVIYDRTEFNPTRFLLRKFPGLLDPVCLAR